MESGIPYNNPFVRDLAWALSSPPLLQRRDRDVHWPDTRWYTHIGADYHERLLQLDRQPAPLSDALASPADRRLGSYFESLWRFWLNDNPRYRLLHANLAVHTGQRTLGEFDFLVQDREAGKTLHWEIAVKFYLGTDDTNRPENWWGPARRDRLDIKTSRMLEHQGRLSERPAARELLRQLGLRVDEAWLLVKGRLFYPVAGSAAAPAGTAADHLRGFWVTQAALPSFIDSRWLELERQQWLAPLKQSAISACLDQAALQEKWCDTPLQHPVCVARIADGVEIDRGFIVPDDWDQPA